MRKLVLSLALLLVVAAVAVLALRGPRREWSTSSPEALAAFGRGLDDLMRFYREDAHREFARALELDPGFVAAKLQLFETTMDPAARKRLFAEVEAADRSRLTPRERFLVEILLVGHDQAKRAEIISRHLAERPKDPWVVFVAAGDAWNRQDWASAEELYRRLLASDPNWVMAHNNLGYIAMAQGRFEEAEERFRTYAFVAPDQANPHDSLGELLILRGRYAEARRELESALAVRPDFCASYANLATLAMLENRPAEVDALLPRIESHCGAAAARDRRCERDRWTALRQGEFAGYWTATAPECLEQREAGDVLSFRLALLGGRRGQAETQLAKLRSRVGEAKVQMRGKAAGGAARLASFEAIRAAHDGELQQAIGKLAEADALSPYWSDSNFGLLKMANRLLAAQLHERTGNPGGAARLRAEVAAVNPSLAELEASWLIAVP